MGVMAGFKFGNTGNMIIRSFWLSLVFISSFNLFITVPASAQTEDSLKIREIGAHQTEPGISTESDNHVTFYNPTSNHCGQLLIHLPGTSDSPNSTLLFPSMAANMGFHAFNLKYPNSSGSAYSACNSSSDPSCYLNFRKEVLQGIDFSTEANVDSVNSIYNRIIRLIEYLDLNFPSEDWGQFIFGGQLIWNKVVLSGHSQGGGHAAVAAIDHAVKRVLMFASPNDYSNTFSAPANWTNMSKATADSCFFGFASVHDELIGDIFWQTEAWAAMGLDAFGDTTNVDHANSPYSNSRQLYTSYDTTGIFGDHSVMLLDFKTPVDATGEPLFKPVWQYMLGSCSTTGIVEPDESSLSLYPNPSSEHLIIEADYTTYSIVDLSGKVITSGRAPQNKIIDTTHLDNGIYLIRIDGGKTTRFIKISQP